MSILALLVIAAIIINAVRRAAAQKPKRMSMRPTPTFAGGDATSYSRVPEQEWGETELDEEVDSQAFLNEELAEYANSDIAVHVQKTVQKPAQKQPKASPRTDIRPKMQCFAETVEVEDVNPFCFEADEIRKAVIYSEILNRKDY